VEARLLNYLVLAAILPELGLGYYLLLLLDGFTFWKKIILVLLLPWEIYLLLLFTALKVSLDFS